MKKWTVYLGIALTALVLSACGGGGDGGVGRPDYKITKENTKESYTTFVAALYNAEDALDLILEISPAIGNNNFKDSDCYTVKLSGNTTMITLNKCVIEEAKLHDWIKSKYGKLSFEGNLTQDGNRTTLNGLEIKTGKGQEFNIENDSILLNLYQNINSVEDTQFKDFSMRYSDGHISTEVDNLEWGTNKDDILTIKGYVSANIIDNKWIKLESSDDFAPEGGAGNLALYGSEKTSLKLLFHEDNQISVYLNGDLLKTYNGEDSLNKDYLDETYQND